MKKRMLSVALGLAVLIGGAGIGSATKVKMNYECTCTCVATDDKGNRVEGAENFTFQTSGDECTVGQKTPCHVGAHKGTYASCTGRDIRAKTPVVPSGGAATKH